jgi:hypothetical protein
MREAQYTVESVLHGAQHREVGKDTTGTKNQQIKAVKSPMMCATCKIPRIAAHLVDAGNIHPPISMSLTRMPMVAEIRVFLQPR